MPILHKNINTASDIHVPQWFPSANNGDYAWKNEVGELESTDELLLPSALDFVDASATPPTTNAGDIYVLSSGVVDPSWGSVNTFDWVRYDGTQWNSITPQKSSLCYNKASDSLLSFSGTAWVAIGGGITNVTTAEKVALTPATGDFVYDTDLESLQRYDGSNWVDISKGYGLMAVYNENNGGVPTYFIDPQSALNTCKTGTNTFTLYDNVEITSEILIDNSFTHEYLTIDLNGFSIINNQADTDAVINYSAPVTSRTLFSNGSLIRNNGTSANTFETPTSGSYKLDMSKMYIYNNNYRAARIRSTVECDFGGSVFEGEATGSLMVLQLRAGRFSNFTAINNNTGDAVEIVNSGFATEFSAFNRGTGGALIMSSDVDTASNFYAQSVSGAAVERGTAINFTAVSTSGNAVLNCFRASGFTAITGNAIAVRGSIDSMFDFKAFNNSSSETVLCSNLLELYNAYAYNEGSGYAFNISVSQTDRNYSYSHLTGVSEGGIGGFFNAQVVDSTISLSEFVSRLDTTSGHSLELNNNNGKLLNCTFKTENSGANGLFASGATSVSAGNCTFFGMTTAINANVTVNASTDLGNGNRLI